MAAFLPTVKGLLPGSTIPNATFTQLVGASPASQITVNTGDNLLLNGGGNIDFGGVTISNLIFPPPSFLNVTLLGNTTVAGTNFNITAPNTTFGVGTTLDVTGVNVVGLVLNNATFTGTSIFMAPGDIEVDGTAKFDVGVSITPTVSNMTGSPFGLWIDSGDTTHPQYGNFGPIALVSDIVAPSFNNVNITGSSSISGTLAVPANTSFTGTLSSTQSAQLPGGLVLTPTAANPTGSPTGVWVSNANPTRPNFGPNTLALFSDVVPPSFNNVAITGNSTISGTMGISAATTFTGATNLNGSNTVGGSTTFNASVTFSATSVPSHAAGLVLQGTASNPTGSAQGLWVANADLTRPVFGNSGTLALLSDITPPSFNNVNITGNSTVSGTLALSSTNTFSGASTFSGDAVFGKAVTFTPTVTNPSVTPATAMWVDSADPTRPIYNASAIAFLSDVMAPSWNNVNITGTSSISGVLSVTAATTFAGAVTFNTGPLVASIPADLQAGLILPSVAANPTGSPNFGLWVDSADPTRPVLGSNPIALLSDIVPPSFNSIAITGNSTIAGTLGVSANVTSTGDALFNKGVSFTPTVSNPSATPTTALWVDSADTTRLVYATSPIAFLSDIVAPSFNNANITGNSTISGTMSVSAAITFTGATNLNGTNSIGGASTFTNDATFGKAVTFTPTVSNPSATPATALWVDSADTTRPVYATSPIAFLSDIVAPSFNNANITGNSTISGTMAVSAAITFTGATNLNGTNSVGGTSTFTGATNLNGANSVGGVSTFTNDATFGKAVTFTPTASNPSATPATALWVDSGDTTRPVYATSPIAFLSDIVAPSFNNANITGNSTISGTMSVSATITFTGATNLNGTNSVGGVTTFTNDAVFDKAVTLTPTATNPSATPATAIWADSGNLLRPVYNTSPLALLSDIVAPSFNNANITGNSTISGTMAVSATITFNNGIDLIPTPSNPQPGGNLTLWADSSASNAFRYESSAVITQSGGLVTTANTIPVFTDAQGGVTGAPVTTIATLNRTLIVLSPITGGFTPGIVSTFRSHSSINNTFIVIDANHATSNQAGIILTGPTQNWSFGSDLASEAVGSFALRDNTASVTALRVEPTTHIVNSIVGSSSVFLTLNSATSNPPNATSTSIWHNSTDVTSRPRWGIAGASLALLTDITAPTWNNVNITGVSSISGSMTVNAPILMNNGVRFGVTASNPTAGTATIWLNNVDTTRPRWKDSEQLVIRSDLLQLTASISVQPTAPTPWALPNSHTFLFYKFGVGGMMLMSVVGSIAVVALPGLTVVSFNVAAIGSQYLPLAGVEGNLTRGGTNNGAQTPFNVRITDAGIAELRVTSGATFTGNMGLGTTNQYWMSYPAPVTI